MSRLFEALQQSTGLEPGSEIANSVEVLKEFSDSFELESVRSLHLTNAPGRRLISLEEDHAGGAERFRLLATRMKYAQDKLGFKKVLITSSARAEGKSFVSANLAISLARNKQKVLLIDGDLRQPTLEELFGVPGASGIAEWAAEGKESAMKYLHRAKDLPLWFLAAGSSSVQASSVLQPRRVSELISQVSDSFDWVLVDSPPMVPFAETMMWAAACERVLLVVREGATSRKLLRETVEGIEKSKLLGAILNDASRSDDKLYYHYYQKRNRSAAKAAGA